MEILQVKVSPLPEGGDHSTLAFCEVTLGKGRPLLVLRPFVIVQVGGGLKIEWPRKKDKKRGGYYLFAEAVDKRFKRMIEEAVLCEYEAMKSADW